ncbi:hypothetical protein D3C85_1135600 [compost metagenome]
MLGLMGAKSVFTSPTAIWPTCSPTSTKLVLVLKMMAQRSCRVARLVTWIG